MQVGCDISGWTRKSRAIRRELVATVPKAIETVSDRVHKQTIKNLSGNAYLPGKLPVRRITATLARSIRKLKINWRLMAIFADERVASYAKYVHNGTRYLRPRRFLGDAVSGNRAWGYKVLENTIIKAIRKVGR